MQFNREFTALQLFHPRVNCGIVMPRFILYTFNIWMDWIGYGYIGWMRTRELLRHFCHFYVTIDIETFILYLNLSCAIFQSCSAQLNVNKTLKTIIFRAATLKSILLMFLPINDTDFMMQSLLFVRKWEHWNCKEIEFSARNVCT